MNRASPAELRKALEAAAAYAKAGLLFVPIPVMNEDDHVDLKNQATDRIQQIVKILEDLEK